MGAKMLVFSAILHTIHLLASLCTILFNLFVKLKRTLSTNHHKQFACSSRNIKTLQKVPTHVGIVVVEEEISYSDIAKMTLWCIGLGMSYVTIYDSGGLCKQNIEHIQEEFEIQKKKLLLAETINKYTIHIESGIQHKTQVASSTKSVYVRILSMCDGRQQLVALARDMSSAVSRHSMKLSDIEPLAADNLLIERTGFPDIDLVLRFGNTPCLIALAPWQIRLTEFLSLPSHKNIDFASFHTLLESYGNKNQRFGK